MDDHAIDSILNQIDPIPSSASTSNDAPVPTFVGASQDPPAVKQRHRAGRGDGGVPKKTDRGRNEDAYRSRTGRQRSDSPIPPLNKTRGKGVTGPLTSLSKSDQAAGRAPKTKRQWVRKPGNGAGKLAMAAMATAISDLAGKCDGVREAEASRAVTPPGPAPSPSPPPRAPARVVGAIDPAQMRPGPRTGMVHTKIISVSTGRVGPLHAAWPMFLLALVPALLVVLCGPDFSGAVRDPVLLILATAVVGGLMGMMLSCLLWLGAIANHYVATGKIAPPRSRVIYARDGAYRDGDIEHDYYDIDRRGDSHSVGEMTHNDPRLFWYNRLESRLVFGIPFGYRCGRQPHLVSMELLALCLQFANSSPNLTDDDVVTRMVQSARSNTSINLDRYLDVDDDVRQSVYEQTACLAVFIADKRRKKARRHFLLPNPRLSLLQSAGNMDTGMMRYRLRNLIPSATTLSFLLSCLVTFITGALWVFRRDLASLVLPTLMRILGIHGL